MKKRSPIAVLLLPFVTFGLYGLYWEVSTKQEMVKRGADIPTAWCLIIPLVNIWWLYKYSLGVEKVTNGKLSGILAFILLFVLGVIGAAIVQDSFNGVTDTPTSDPVPTPAQTTPTVPQA